MTPKEQAEIIMRKMLHEVSGVPEPLIFMYHKGDVHVETARQCALITINEIKNVITFDDLRFWDLVRQEIEVI